MILQKKQCDELILEEDYIIMIECEECGNTEDTEEQICSECGNEDVIPTTNHEGMDCEVCGASIDMWEDALIGLGNNSGVINVKSYERAKLSKNKNGYIVETIEPKTTNINSLQYNNEFLNQRGSTEVADLIGQNIFTSFLFTSIIISVF